MKTLNLSWKIIWFLIQALFILLILDNIPYGNEFLSYGLIAVYSFLVISVTNLTYLVQVNTGIQLSVFKELIKDEDEKENLEIRIKDFEDSLLKSRVEKATYVVFWSIVWIISVNGMLS